MKRTASLILLSLGAFLLVLAPLLRFYVVPRLAVAPLSPGEDTDGINVTRSAGVATTLFDAGRLVAGENPVRTNVAVDSTRNTRGDVTAAQTEEAKSKNLAIYDSFSRLVDPEGTVVSADTLRVAFDRKTSELVNCCGANFNGQDTEFEGINPLKFPMFTQQRDYQYFDTTLGAAVPAVFSGVEKILGHDTYKFVMNIPLTKFATIDVPGSLVGSDEPSVTADREYANIRTLWVEPTTGAIVNGQEEPSQVATDPNGTGSLTLLEAKVGYTEEQIKSSTETAVSSANLLNLLNKTVPLAGLLGGLVALGAGLLLGRRREEPVPYADEEYDWSAPAVATTTTTYDPDATSTFEPVGGYDATQAVTLDPDATQAHVPIDYSVSDVDQVVTPGIEEELASAADDATATFEGEIPPVESPTEQIEIEGDVGPNEDDGTVR